MAIHPSAAALYSHLPCPRQAIANADREAKRLAAENEKLLQAKTTLTSKVGGSLETRRLDSTTSRSFAVDRSPLTPTTP